MKAIIEVKKGKKTIPKDKNSWMPSNGSEFEWFLERYCFYCQKSDDEGYCPIIDSALEGKRPKEWTQDEKFTPSCSEYVNDCEKEKRRHIITCHRCERDVNMETEDVHYLCFEKEEDMMECAYYCRKCKGILEFQRKQKRAGK